MSIHYTTTLSIQHLYNTSKSQYLSIRLHPEDGKLHNLNALDYKVYCMDGS